MANIDKIDSVIDQKVNGEITTLQNNLNALNSSMLAVLASTNNLYTGLGKTDTIKQLMAAIDNEADSTKKLKDLEVQHTLIVTRLAEAQEKLRLSEEALKNARGKSNNAKLTAEERELNAQRNASEKQSARIRIAESQLNEVLQRHSTTAAEAITQNKQLRAAVLNLNPAWESEKLKIDQINAIINKNDVLISSVGDNMVKQKRNIGNYASGFSPLNNAMAQLTREAPAFANSITTGFMAISNNIPILKDAVDQIKAQNAILRAEGKPTESVFKQVMGALFSWETAMSLGIVLLVAYGKDIANWIVTLFQSEKAINANTLAMNAMNAAKTKGIQDSQKERIELKLLYEAATNDTKSKQERLSATNELQKQYPAYFKNLSDENIMVGKAEKVYNILTKALLKNATAKAKLSELDKMATQEWDLEMKAAGKLMEIEQARYNLQYERSRLKEVKETGRSGGVPLLESDVQKDVTEASKKLFSLTSEYNTLTSSIRSSINAQQQLSKSINTKDLTLDVKGEKPKETKQDNTLENKRKELEKSLEEERKLKINADKLIYTDENKSYEERLKALQDFINDSKNNIALSAKEEIREENNKYATQSKNKKLSNKDKKDLEELHNSQLKVITEKANQEQTNIALEGEKTKISILNKQNDDAKKALDDKIKGMETGYDKESALRAKASSESLVDLANQYKTNKISKQKYEDEKIKITQDYINNELQLLLKLANQEADLLQGDEKKNKLKEIAQIEADIAKQNIKNTEEQKKNDDELTKKRKENLSTWLDKSKEAVSSITGLVNAIYEGQINNIQKDQDAYDESAKAKIAKIEEQESKGIITSEQASARKKAITDAQTQYDAEADKKKTALKKKQAILDKATAIAQAGINTAVAITEALPNVPLAIAVGALGAIEVATIIATPLAYKKGTPKGGHPGGDAIVGDGGKSEMVITSKGVFKTPDKPTFLPDLEKGAMVLPDFGEASRMLLNSSLRVGSNSSPTYNDQEVVKGLKELNGELKDIKSVLKRKSRNRDSSSDFQFQAYKNRILGQ